MSDSSSPKKCNEFSRYPSASHFHITALSHLHELPYTETYLPKATASINFSLAQHVHIATSISPARIIEQQIAINSWMIQGFQVFSLNYTDEISILKPHFPYVTFIPVTTDSMPLLGKKRVVISDILDFLAASSQKNDILGIVNSDNSLYQLDLKTLFSCANEGIIFSHRLEFPSGVPYYYGFDSFFFSKSSLPNDYSSLKQFFLGETYWDYDIILEFIACNKPVFRPSRPICFHYTHNINWSQENLIKFSKIFFKLLKQKIFPSQIYNTNLQGIVSINPEETQRYISILFLAYVLHVQTSVDVLFSLEHSS